MRVLSLGVDAWSIDRGRNFWIGDGVLRDCYRRIPDDEEQGVEFEAVGIAVGDRIKMGDWPTELVQLVTEDEIGSPSCLWSWCLMDASQNKVIHA